MKLPLKKILTYACLVLLGIVVVFLVCRAMLNLDDVRATLGGVIASLRAILFGCVMAYLLYPLARFSEQYLLYRTVKPKLARSLSTAIATAALLLLLFLFGYFVIPQLVLNVPTLIQSLPEMTKTSAERLSTWLVAHGQSDTIVQDLATRVTETVEGWLKDDPLSMIKDVADRLISAAMNLLNFIIGIIVMVYLLLSRDQFTGQAKKILYATVRRRSTCDAVLKHVREINQIFFGFVSGKLLDSLIIGIICGVCLAILQMPYTLLISVIVGITNIIPVFGPFFGAIPSAFLLLLVDPMKCLVFIIFIVILQQVDGNVIGPKILGDSTGLSAFWVLFSLLLFNHLMGFWGMLLGVPLFASFYYLLRELVDSRLRKRHLPESTEEFMRIDHIDASGTVHYAEQDLPNFRPIFVGEDSVLRQLVRSLTQPSAHLRRIRQDYALRRSASQVEQAAEVARRARLAADLARQAAEQAVREAEDAEGKALAAERAAQSVRDRADR